MIEKKFHSAQLQGPANAPTNNTQDKLIFVSNFVGNFSHKNTPKLIDNALKNTNSERINKVFDGCSTMIAYKQPPNLLRQLTKASFATPSTIIEPKPNGLYRCNRRNCKLCQLYIQECTSFVCSNGKTWEIRSHITCHSIYYLKCVWCDDDVEIETYTGKTNDFRLRMNNHISSCKTGHGTDKFDRHVFDCRQKHPNSREPWFQVYAFFTVKDQDLLPAYEKHLHRLGLDTLNRPK